MLKFRTMVDEADAIRGLLRKEANQENELFKLEEDPRVTEIGAMLRRTSLDELPQLLNVLWGDMSLVGPRPFEPDDACLFEYPYRERFFAFPGMTGIWQISGRSDLTFKDMCRLEAEYLGNWSLWQDFVILLKTVPVVLTKKGAY